MLGSSFSIFDGRLQHVTSDSREGMVEDTGAELKIPPITAILDPTVFLPIACSFVLFQVFACIVRGYFWKDTSVKKQGRLHNVSISFVHATFTGLWAFGFAVFNMDLMLNHTLHWYATWARVLPLISIGYFIHDSLDILHYGVTRWTLELLAHHVAATFLFSCAVLSRKLILYSYWALLMEISSAFLHARTISQLSGLSQDYPGVHNCIRYLNFATFIVFRFMVQAWQIWWINSQRFLIHPFYYFAGLYGGIFFTAVNVCIFIRLLAADGVLGWAGCSRHRYSNYKRDVSGQLVSQC